uniref:Uncharacterized protein n=1 Tax=Arundo donax TaxID=35708 RepID=A0A0A9FT53_ARUDO
MVHHYGRKITQCFYRCSITQKIKLGDINSSMQHIYA